MYDNLQVNLIKLAISISELTENQKSVPNYPYHQKDASLSKLIKRAPAHNLIPELAMCPPPWSNFG